MGSLRIIAGELRGRRLATPPGTSVRPTGDRVREALFSILGAGVQGASVLDPFAGSGALGFEALSRGARCATFYESDRVVLEYLRRNAAALGVEARCRIEAGRAEYLVLREPPGPRFDLVLVDAPYGDSPLTFLKALGRSPCLADEAVVVIEREKSASDDLWGAAGLSVFDSRTYGRARLVFLEPATGDSPGDDETAPDDVA